MEQEKKEMLAALKRKNGLVASQLQSLYHNQTF